MVRRWMLLLAWSACGVAGAQVHPIENVAPDAIAAYVAASKGMLLVNVSSTDPGCGYCIQANARFEEMSRRHDLDEDFRLVQVSWRPWAPLPTSLEHFLQPYGVNGIPVRLVFVDGKYQRKMPGVPAALPPESPRQVTGDIPLVDRLQVADRIAASRGVLVVQWTSFETACVFCMRGNPIFEELVRRNDDPRVHFLRVAYAPWTRVGSDAFAQSLHASGLPFYATFEDGKPVRSKQGSFDVEVLQKELLDGLH